VAAAARHRPVDVPSPANLLFRTATLLQ